MKGRSALDGAMLFPDLAFHKSLIEKELTRCKEEEQYELPPLLWSSSSGSGAEIIYHGLQSGDQGWEKRESQEALKPAVASWSQRGSVFIVSNLGIHYAEYFRSNKTISFVIQWKTGLRKFLLESSKSFPKTFALFLWTKRKHMTFLWLTCSL